MTTQHAPGPWEIVEMTTTKRKEVRIVAAGRTVCETWMNSSFGDVIGGANTKLIAAAPDLLEALHAIYQNLSDVPADERTIYDDQNLQLAASAIQKATL